MRIFFPCIFVIYFHIAKQTSYISGRAMPLY